MDVYTECTLTTRKVEQLPITFEDYFEHYGMVDASRLRVTRGLGGFQELAQQQASFVQQYMRYSHERLHIQVLGDGGSDGSKQWKIANRIVVSGA
jgi:hypothetical protein